MTHFNQLIRRFALAATMIWPTLASAGIITVNFPQDVVPGTTTNTGNATADGFRISPSAEYTLVNSGGSAGGVIERGLGWDSDGPANPFYLGPAHPSDASLFVDAGGMGFSLLSAEFIAQHADDNFQMTSSKGGVLDVPANLVGTFDATLSGAQWTDITWLLFSYFDAGPPTAGLEQLVFAVDEPETMAAFALGLVLLIVLRRPRLRTRPR